jgi:hypothetical protein
LILIISKKKWIDVNQYILILIISKKKWIDVNQ